MYTPVISDSPAIFVGQSKTKLVLGKITFKVPNKYPPSCKNPAAERFAQEIEPDRKMKELEQMYHDFCKKAYQYLLGHSSLQGGFHPHQIIFPDFIYEIIPSHSVIPTE